jgi:hypothetical protein
MIGRARADAGKEVAVILYEFRERSWPATEKHRNIGRDSIVGRAVSGRDVGEIKRTPTRNTRREQPGFIGLRRDWLIYDGSASDNGERSRNLVVAVGDGPSERIGFTGVCDVVAEYDRCGSAYIAGVNKGKAVVSHRSCEPSISPNRVCGAQ